MMAKLERSKLWGRCFLGPLLAAVVIAGASCQGPGSLANPTSDAAPGSGADAPSVTLMLDAPLTSGDGCVRSVQTSCTALGVQYCGPIGDNCGGTVDCGTCANGKACVNSMCAASLDCDAGPLTSCQVSGGRYCGTIGNRCGGTLECGNCPDGQICDGHVCKGGPTCVPVT